MSSGSDIGRTIAAALAAAVVVAPAALATTAAAAPLSTLRSSTLPSPQPSPSDAPAMLALAQRYATALRGLNGPVVEQTFLGNMISHHAAAVAMAQLELTRGTHPEAKTLARQIITAQNREITEMTAWLRQWYGLTAEQAQQKAPATIRALTNHVHNGLRSMQSRLAAVPAGPNFDKAFLAAMVPHHEMAMVIADAMPGRATHSQVTALAQQISTSQTGQVAQMRDWLRAWYGASG
ncbi:DUF305 domain-containing protein [Streptomyces sp. NPDC005731]|uniref:DUF305 domain-containing protein n=1 Tax=Streptomyces sp. NPDC005731 TaxID=3157056 RepID=UPI0033DF498B